MSNASTPDGRGQDRPNDAESFFPSEGTFNAVVPFAEIGHAPAPLAPFDPADAGKPAEAAWAREAHRARWREEEETLVPSRAGRARRARPSWLTTAAVITLSVLAGLVSGTYLIRSAQRTAATEPPAEVAVEALPTLPPAPVAEPLKAEAKAEVVSEVVKDSKSNEVAKAGKSDEVARTPEPETPIRNAPRTERAAAEPREVMPAPKPSRTQSASPSRPRPTNVVQQTPRATLPISTPPPTAKSKKVIQWP